MEEIKIVLNFGATQSTKWWIVVDDPDPYLDSRSGSVFGHGHNSETIGLKVFTWFTDFHKTFVYVGFVSDTDRRQKIKCVEFGILDFESRSVLYVKETQKLMGPIFFQNLVMLVGFGPRNKR